MQTVSILTPIYGVEKYIEQCARSLFEQSYANIEYIFVNDCTKDRSIEILESVMADYPERAKQVSIIQHEHNKGLGAARHTAFGAATGKYVMHVDSDDILPLDAVRLLVEAAETNHADVVDGGYAEWENGQVSNPCKAIHASHQQYERWLLCQNITTNRIWGRIYRREMLMEHGINSIEGIDYGEDYIVVARALFHAKRHTINDIVYYYRKDNITSYTHDLSEKNLKSYFKACQLVASFIEQEDREGIYRTATDIGMVNAYRLAARYHVSLSRVDEICTYQVRNVICRLCIALFKRGWKENRVNYLYLSFRRLYALLA